MRCFKLFSISALMCAFIFALAVLPSRLCFNGEVYTFYCGDSSKNCKEITVNDNAALKRLTLSDVCGECALYQSLDIEEFLKSVGGRVVFKEELSDSVNYYCKADLPYKVDLYGEEINLHISVRDDGVKVASPIIFGGY